MDKYKPVARCKGYRLWKVGPFHINAEAYRYSDGTIDIEWTVYPEPGDEKPAAAFLLKGGNNGNL